MMMKPRTERAKDRVEELGEIKRLSDMTPLDLQLLGVIYAASRLNGSGYVAAWKIGELLGKPAAWLDSRVPPTDGDNSMDRLIAAGLVEEMEDLGCRYRLRQEN
jgi:hypothetical protein